MSKDNLRRHYHNVRTTIATDIAAEWSSQIASHLIHHLRNSGFKGTLFIFKSLRGEPDLLPHLSVLRSHLALPRVGSSGAMNFHLWTTGDPLVKSSLGVYEPLPEAIKIGPQLGDVVIVPALAIDLQGRRLGFGAGYYDRWLALNRSVISQIIGVVFPPCFSSTPLVSEPHDIAVDLCVMPGQCVNFSDTR
jgi:5-formyltetrahydrofolate cyclo-ligase